MNMTSVMAHEAHTKSFHIDSKKNAYDIDKIFFDLSLLNHVHFISF